jgi:primosomal protein N' (replication factor Y)
MAGVVVSGPDEAKVHETALALARNAGVLTGIGAQVFGPASAPVARVRGRHRVRLLVKAPKGLAFQPALAAWRAQIRPSANLRIAIDIDPQSFY